MSWKVTRYHDAPDVVQLPRTRTVELEYADTCPSLNAAGTRGSHWAVTKAKRRWQDIFEALLLTCDLPRNLQHVRASARMRFPVARRRDVDNHSWLLVKALGDSLTRGGYLVDDTPQFFTFTGLEFEEGRGPRRTVVRLEARI